MDENLNTVDAVQENVVDSQSNEQASENVQSVNAESEGVASSQQETKPVQTPEQNAFYADIRRKAEAETRDKTIQQLSNGQFNNWAEYEKAVQAQQEQQQREQYQAAGLDPDLINQLINNNPIVQQANEIITKQQREERFNNDVQELFNQFPEARNEDIPEEILLKYIDSKGETSLSTLYAPYAVSQLKNKLAEYEKGSKTAEVNSKNADSTPGSTTGNGTNKGDFISKETFEANKNNQRWLDQNYDKLTNSMNRW